MLVYRCTNLVSGKVYVGKTSTTLRRRWTEHCSAARRGSSYLFHRAIRKYGPDAFKVEVIGEATTLATLDALEQQCIQDEASLVPGGYNLRAGGEGGPHSPETRELLRQKALGRRLTEEHRRAIGLGVSGPRNGFYGKQHSEQTKQVLRLKCGVTHAGVALTPEHREKIQQGLKAHKRTPEHAQNLSAALRGRTLTVEHRERIGASQRGVSKPEGHGDNVSKALKGRAKSPEHRQRLREAALRRASRDRGDSC